MSLPKIIVGGIRRRRPELFAIDSVSGWYVLDNGKRCPPEYWDRLLEEDERIQTERSAAQYGQRGTRLWEIWLRDHKAP